MPLPDRVKILGIVYSVTYVDNPSDVDIHRRESLWGQVDHWTSSIRIYKRAESDNSAAFQTLWHEILHAVAVQLHIHPRDGVELNEDENAIDLLATGISTVLVDNGWMLPFGNGE